MGRGIIRARAARLAMWGCLTLALIGSAEGARAAGAIGFTNWDGALPSVTVAQGGSATATGIAGLKSSMAGNPDLNGSAWAHTGDWFSIRLQDSASVTIRIEATNAAQLAPGVAVWASGAAPFDGGTQGFGGEISTAGFGTPHSFNAFGELGDPGTLWMADGYGGNMAELIAYAISGPSFLGTTGWGETIANGAHDMSLTNTFADAVSGSVGLGFVELVLTNVHDSWFSIYAGGTDHVLSGGTFDLTVTSVPEPATALLVGIGLIGLRAAGRSRSR
jgi:hypothetical protein